MNLQCRDSFEKSVQIEEKLRIVVSPSSNIEHPGLKTITQGIVLQILRIPEKRNTVLL